MAALELKIPPPAVTLTAGLLMWLAARAIPELGFPNPARDYLAIGVAFAGLVTAVRGLIAFRRAGTTVNPMKPETTSSLVASGVYRWTRNPMYVGLLFVLLGWGVFLSNVAAFVVLPAFVLYLNRFQIEPEERALATRFGQEFAAYKARVRRWL